MERPLLADNANRNKKKKGEKMSTLKYEALEDIPSLNIKKGDIVESEENDGSLPYLDIKHKGRWYWYYGMFSSCFKKVEEKKEERPMRSFSVSELSYNKETNTFCPSGIIVRADSEEELREVLRDNRVVGYGWEHFPPIVIEIKEENFSDYSKEFEALKKKKAGPTKENVLNSLMSDWDDPIRIYYSAHEDYYKVVEMTQTHQGYQLALKKYRNDSMGLREWLIVEF